jgi:hypothetical protein
MKLKDLSEFKFGRLSVLGKASNIGKFVEESV